MSLINKYEINIKNYLPKRVHNFYEPFSFTLENFSNLEFIKGVAFIDKSQINTATLVKTIKYYYLPLKSLIKEIQESPNLGVAFKDAFDEPALQATNTFSEFKELVLVEDWAKITRLAIAIIEEHQNLSQTKIFDLIDNYYEKFNNTVFFRNNRFVFNELEKDKNNLENIQDSYIFIQLENNIMETLTEDQKQIVFDYLKNLQYSSASYLVITDFKIEDFKENTKIQKQEFDPFLYIYHNLEKHPWFDFPSTILKPEDVVDKNVVEEARSAVDYGVPIDDESYDDGSIPPDAVDDEEGYIPPTETPIDAVPPPRVVPSPIPTTAISPEVPLTTNITSNLPHLSPEQQFASQQAIPPPMVANVANQQTNEAVKAANRKYITKENAKVCHLKADAIYRQEKPYLQEQVDLGNHIKSRDKVYSATAMLDNPALNFDAEDLIDDDTL